MKHVASSGIESPTDDASAVDAIADVVSYSYG